MSNRWLHFSYKSTLEKKNCQQGTFSFICLHPIRNCPCPWKTYWGQNKLYAEKMYLFVFSFFSSLFAQCPLSLQFVCLFVCLFDYLLYFFYFWLFAQCPLSASIRRNKSFSLQLLLLWIYHPWPGAWKVRKFTFAFIFLTKDFVFLTEAFVFLTKRICISNTGICISHKIIHIFIKKEIVEFVGATIVRSNLKD